MCNNKNESQKHHAGPPRWLSRLSSWASESWFPLRSWYQGCGIEPCVRLHAKLGACLRYSLPPLSLPLPHSHAHILSPHPKNINNNNDNKDKIFKLKKFFYICLFLRERSCSSGRGAERERDRESKAGARLWAVSTEPDERLELTNREIVTWAGH